MNGNPDGSSLGTRSIESSHRLIHEGHYLKMIPYCTKKMSFMNYPASVRTLVGPTGDSLMVMWMFPYTKPTSS